MPKDKVRGGKRSQIKLGKGELRLKPGAVKSFNKEMRESVKSGKPGSAVKTTSSGFKTTKTNSPRKPSVPNKVKSQGAKTISQGMKYSQGRKNK